MSQGSKEKYTVKQKREAAKKLKNLLLNAVQES